MNSDWDSEDEQIEPKITTSLHIPINAESKEEYDEWVKDDCNDLWWYNKERLRIEKIETPTQNNPCYSDVLKEILAFKDEELLQDFYNRDWESFSRRLKIE